MTGVFEVLPGGEEQQVCTDPVVLVSRVEKAEVPVRVRGPCDDAYALTECMCDLVAFVAALKGLRLNRKHSEENQDRQARLAAIHAKQRASERKRSALIFGSISTVLLAVIVAVTLVVVSQVQTNRQQEAAANQPIEGIQEFTDLTFDHTEADVEYEQASPVGGNHAPVWTNCGVYTAAVPDETSVHSMEHGAVWITYDPELGQDQIDQLNELVGTRSYVLLSPAPNADAPITASAWGLQLKVDNADDPRLETFLTKYIQGEQSREPGATCSGGVTPAGAVS